MADVHEIKVQCASCGEPIDYRVRYCRVCAARRTRASKDRHRKEMQALNAELRAKAKRTA